MRAAFLGLGAIFLAGCADPEKAAEPNSGADNAKYQEPPAIVSIDPTADGGLMIRGKGEPSERIRAVTSAGVSYGVTTDAQGAFATTLPPSLAPRLITLSAERDAGETPADGALFLPPDGVGAVILRPGAGALLLSPRPAPISAIDYDESGTLLVSGRANPHSAVHLHIDGKVVAEGQSSSTGLYSLAPAQALTPGRHVFKIEGGAYGEYALDILPQTLQGAGSATKVEAGWRVTWPLKGGGAQTTLIVTAPPKR